jgi:DNA-binding NarL/FixJ family response regulator
MQTDRATLRVLTKREQEIVALVCVGLANKIIARRLGISEGTVKSHLNQIYRKLGVQNRTTLIITFRGQHGIDKVPA